MRRVLCAAAVAAAAFAVPAHAAQPVGPVSVTYVNDDDHIGVGTSMPHQPLVGVVFYKGSNTLCAGMSYQIPFCVSVPIQVGG